MKHLNQYVHLPRGSNNPFGSNMKERTLTGINNPVYTIDDLLTPALSYDVDHHTSNQSFQLNMQMCDFSKITDNFKVTYVCNNCRRRQPLFDSSSLRNILVNTIKSPTIKANCSYCYKQTKFRTKILFEKTLSAYTQKPKKELPKELVNICIELVNYIDFYNTLVDTPKQGIESYDDGIADAAAYATVRHSSYIPTSWGRIK